MPAEAVSAKGWQRLCKRCATARLNNPWNALLNMRKVAPEPERITHDP